MNRSETSQISRSPKGNIFIISAPSGAGKSTLCKLVADEFKDMGYSVSHTTREPREGEVDGTDYHFISHDEFEKMIEKGEWAEWARVHGNYYGTSCDFLSESIDKGRDILLDIDVQGARQIVERFPASVTIFIMPPSMEVLRERLLKRGTDSLDVIEKRLKNAEAEIEQQGFYKHILVNDSLEDAVEELLAIMKSYR